MAVALVVGQAVLCAFIGWMTLGRSRSEPVRPPGSAVVDQLAIPPLAGPAPPSLTSRSTVVPSKQARKPTTPTSRASPRRSATTAVPPSSTVTRTPEPILAPPEEPALLPPAPPPPSATPPATTRPTTPAPDVVQEPVRVGDECRPEGAYGRTADGELVRCVREWRHRSRWKIV